MSFKLGANRYGKENVRILRVVRDTPKHEVTELKVQILLEGDFDEAFTEGSNRKIVATDTQKNTLYAYSKKYPLDSIENWAVRVSKDMLERFSHVTAVNLKIEQVCWERIKIDGKEHNHAFKKGSNGIRTCSSRISRSDISITSGFKEFQVLKTTQSGFEGFIRDEFTTLPETKDRVLSTKVRCNWTYNNSSSWTDSNSSSSSSRYSEIFHGIQAITLSVFSGETEKGVYSPSVQQTIYDIGTSVLKKYPEVEKISFTLPNIHYFLVDFKQFKSNLVNNNEVFFTSDGAAGHIEGTVERNPTSTAIKARL